MLDSQNDILRLAYNYANSSHFGQKRRDGEDFINHPIRVAAKTQNFCKKLSYSNEDIDELTAAAYLHDTIEDCNISVSEIEKLFGIRISKLVLMLTNYSALRDKDNWPEFKFKRPSRKIRERFNLAKLKIINDNAKIIKLADIYDNVNSLKSLVGIDDGFVKMYIDESKAKLDIITNDYNICCANEVRQLIELYIK